MAYPEEYRKTLDRSSNDEYSAISGFIKGAGKMASIIYSEETWAEHSCLTVTSWDRSKEGGRIFARV